MGNEFQFIDIIFLAAVAVFIAVKLRSTLGQDSGDGPQPRARMRRADAEQERVIQLPGTTPAPEKTLAEDMLLLAEMEDENLSKTLIEIKEADNAFSVGEFVGGAKTAFEWVFDAFAQKNRKLLKTLLAKDVYEDFSSALDAIEKDEQQPDSTLVAIESAEIIGAELKKHTARLTVKFISEQISLMRNKDGRIVDGDPSQVDTVESEWVFERDLKAGTPNWQIVAT